MCTLTFTVPDETAEQLVRAARDRGVPVDELLRTATAEFLARSAEFQSAAPYVLETNTELYQRLAK